MSVQLKSGLQELFKHDFRDQHRKITKNHTLPLIEKKSCCLV